MKGGGGGDGADRRAGCDEITGDQAAAVFRRAAELDVHRLSTSGGGLDLAALEQAGAEAGLSREAIRQALAEIRAGTLEVNSPRSDAVVARTLDMPADAAEGAVDRFMQQQSFRVQRRLPDRTIWAPDKSFWAQLRRGLDFNKTIVVREVTQLSTCVVSIPGDRGRSHVRFDMDLNRARWGWNMLPIWTAIISAGGIITAGAFGADPLAVVAGVSAGGLATGGAYVGARAGYRGSMRRSAIAIERFLDHLQLGR